MPVWLPTARFELEFDKVAFEAARKARTEADDADVTEFLLHCAGSPIVLGVDSAVYGAKGQHSVRAEAGYHLAPQQLPAGQDLWQLLGPEFTLLNFGPGVATGDAFRQAASTLGIPLQHVHLPDAALLAAYGAACLLVRPDQFIAWAGGADVDAISVLATATGRVVERRI